jgi:Nucleotidyl transferase AbiEii toxin, Type IV TA system
MTNTRMKDYFDLSVLLDEGTLDAGQLRRAIEATFTRRKTPMPASVPTGLSNAFALDPVKQTQWNAFLKKNRLDSMALEDMVATQLFIRYVRQVPLDNIPIPTQILTDHGAGRSPKAVSRNLLLGAIAQRTQGAVECVVTHIPRRF